MKSKLNIRMKLSFIFYLLFLLITISFSVVYLTRSEFMPYHAVAIGQKWAEIDSGFQSLFLALMKATAGGWASTAIAVLILLIKPFRQGAIWSYWAIPAIGLPPSVVNLYNAVHIASNTPSSTPWIMPALAIVFLLLGMLFSLIPQSR